MQSSPLSTLLGTLQRWFNPQLNQPPMLAISLWIDRPRSADGRQPGRLTLFDGSGQILLGDCPLQTYGKTPIGDYQVTAIRLTGPGTPYAAEFYGQAGLVMLEMMRNGTTVYAMIQGGDRSPKGDLLAPTGGFQLRNPAMQSLIIALETMELPMLCRVREAIAPKPSARTQTHETRSSDDDSDSFSDSFSVGSSDSSLDYEPNWDPNCDPNWDSSPALLPLNDDGYC